MTINKSGSQGLWPYDLFSCVQDLCFGKIGLLSRLVKLRWLQKSLKRKTQMAFALAGGLSKPDWCRLELYGWPWHSALVSEHWIGRGMDCWGSKIWTIAVLLMRKTSTTFLDCFAFPGRTGKHVLDIGVFKKDCFSLSDLLTLSGFEIKPWSFWNQELKIWSWTWIVCLLGSLKEFEDDLKNGSGQDGCFTSFWCCNGQLSISLVLVRLRRA